MSHLPTFAEWMMQVRDVPDPDWPLYDLALSLAVVGESIDPSVLEKARVYGRELGPRVRAHFHDLRAAGADDNAGTRLAALKHVIVDQDGIIGDHETYDDPANLSLPRVIERKRGIPITLAIIYLHAAKGCGWSAAGLNFPGHFLVRLDHQGQVLIVDVFDHCRVLAAHDLRQLIKAVNGADAELAADYYVPVGPRAVLIRLQNNLKIRHIAAGDYRGALGVIDRMRLIDPDEPRLLLDTGVMYAKLGEAALAIPALEEYLAALPPRHPHRRDAEDLLAELRGA